MPTNSKEYMKEYGLKYYHENADKLNEKRRIRDKEARKAKKILKLVEKLNDMIQEEQQQVSVFTKDNLNFIQVDK
jgi:hypothetical protein